MNSFITLVAQSEWTKDKLEKTSGWSVNAIKVAIHLKLTDVESREV